MVHSTGSKPPMGHTPQLDGIVFTGADASWVHNPHEDALVITVEVANSLIHRLLVDNRSAINILFWDVCQKIGQRRTYLTSMISPIYGFTRNSVIPKRTIKLVVTRGDPPLTVTIVIDFLTVNCPSTFNGVLGKPLLRDLKAMTSIHYLTIKFPTTAGTSQV